MDKYKRVYIEISNICNLQCSFCPVVDRDKVILPSNNFEKILAQVAPITEQVCLHLMGEPLAHPDFDSVLKICDLNKVPTEITTNGLMINKRSKSLLESKFLRQINFSIQSFKDNFPQKSLEDYMKPLLEFTKELNKVRPEVYVNFRLWNIGRNKTNENEEVFSILENFYHIDINRQIQVESIKSKKIWNRVYIHFDSHFDWPSLNYPIQGEKGRCHGLGSHFGIHADGTVVPCCLDKEAVINLGNCLETDLKSVLSSDRANKMREGFAKNELVEDLCRRCSYINRFKN